MNQTVSLTKRVVTEKGMRYCPVVIGSNGRVRPDYVIVNDKPQHHPEGSYYLSWYEGKKLKRISCRHKVGSRVVKDDASAADAARYRQESILNARNNNVTVVEAGKQRLLINEVADHIAEIKAQKKSGTYKAYELALRYFLESCSKQTLEEITRQDLLAFCTFLRDKRWQPRGKKQSSKKLAPRTVSNIFRLVVFFLKAKGITTESLKLTKFDWPTYVEEMPEVFEQDELGKFFAACNSTQRLWFEFFLMTGMREQEVQHATWKAVNFAKGTISVKYNPEFNWSPKAYKERSIPVPQRLLDSLKKWKESKQQKCDLIFPTGKCGIQHGFWDECRAIAERAGMDPKNFWLHKFRASFATAHLRSGVDVVTLQSWMGHDDLASTTRYLRPNDSAAMREKVEATFL